MIIDEDINLENYGNTLEWELCNPSNRVLSNVTSLTIPLETSNNYIFKIRCYLEMVTGASTGEARLEVNADTSNYSETRHYIDSSNAHTVTNGTPWGIILASVPANLTYTGRARVDLTKLSGKNGYYDVIMDGRRSNGVKVKEDVGGFYGVTTDITSFRFESSRTCTGIIEIWAKKKLNVDLGL